MVQLMILQTKIQNDFWNPPKELLKSSENVVQSFGSNFTVMLISILPLYSLIAEESSMLLILLSAKRKKETFLGQMLPVE